MSEVRDSLGFTEADYERMAAESRAAQGLPPKITDPALLDRIVSWIGDIDPDAA